MHINLIKKFHYARIRNIDFDSAQEWPLQIWAIFIFKKTITSLSKFWRIGAGSLNLGRLAELLKILWINSLKDKHCSNTSYNKSVNWYR